jgi:hypothetical protein
LKLQVISLLEARIYYECDWSGYDKKNACEYTIQKEGPSMYTEPKYFLKREFC